MNKKQKLITNLGVFFGVLLISVSIFAVFKLLSPWLKKTENIIPIVPSNTPEVLPAKTENLQDSFASATPSATPSVFLSVTPLVTPSVSPLVTPSASPSLQQSEVSLDDCNKKSDSNYFNIQLTSDSSEIVITYIQPVGNPPSGGDISFPADWKVKPGSEIANGEVLGVGCVREMINGQEFLGTIKVVNNIDIQGKVARWDLVFGDPLAPDVVLETFIDGNPGQGYTWNIQRKLLFDIQPPIVISFKIQSLYLFKQKKGNFVFKAVARLIGGGENVLEKILDVL